MRSVVHHRFEYGDGLAFGVKAWIASSTADISLSVFSCTVPSDGVLFNVSVILLFISFHGAFLSISHCCCFSSAAEISKAVSIAQWSDPCSVPYIMHLSIASLNSSVAKTRSMVVL